MVVMFATDQMPDVNFVLCTTDLDERAEGTRERRYRYMQTPAIHTGFRFTSTPLCMSNHAHLPNCMAVLETNEAPDPDEGAKGA